MNPGVTIVILISGPTSILKVSKKVTIAALLAWGYMHKNSFPKAKKIHSKYNTYIVEAHSRCRQPWSRGSNGYYLASTISEVWNCKTGSIYWAPEIYILREDIESTSDIATPNHCLIQTIRTLLSFSQPSFKLLKNLFISVRTDLSNAFSDEIPQRKFIKLTYILKTLACIFNLEAEWLWITIMVLKSVISVVSSNMQTELIPALFTRWSTASYNPHHIVVTKNYHNKWNLSHFI